MKLSVIVVSYNTRALTLDCIESIYEQTAPGSFELLVVDNASSDGSAEAIRNAFPPAYNPELRLFALDTNLGFAAANNLAAAEARGEYVLLLNPDTVVLDRALEKLAAFADQHPEYGIYGGCTLSADGTVNPTAGWNQPTVWSMFCIAMGLARVFPQSRLFNPWGVAMWSGAELCEVDIVGGCLLLMRRSDWESLGGFDLGFFMYGEDDDLSLRARRDLGLRAVLVSSARIVHYVGASDVVYAERLIKLFKAKMQLFGKHCSPMHTAARARMLELWCIMRIIYLGPAALVSAKSRRTWDQWRAVWRARREWNVTHIAMPADPQKA